jgi:uncharacterized protein (DUF58 family)
VDEAPSRIAERLDPRILARLKGLRVRAHRIVEGYVAGQHRSPFRGFSIEFAEHREYVPGDDLRYVDWKVFGRTDKYYVKQYEDETNLVCYLLLDVSESMRYQGPGVPLSKFEYAQCLAAALGYLVVMQRDAVGLATFDNQLRQWLRPAGNPAHHQQLMSIMESTRPVAKTAMDQTLHTIAERLTKRSLVFILSDCLDDPDSLLRGLKHFRHRRHEVTLLQILDPCELDFPFRGTTLFRGLEQFPDLVADPPSLRAAYLEELQHFLRIVRSGTLEMGMTYRLLRTDQPFDRALTSILHH